jgi:hypothetical protein
MMTKADRLILPEPIHNDSDEPPKILKLVLINRYKLIRTHYHK